MALSRPTSGALVLPPQSTDALGMMGSRASRRRFSRTAGPVMALNFMGGVLPDGLGLRTTRSSSATRVNTAGVIELVAADQPRFDHDPFTGAPRGLLLEGQSTNLLQRSGDLMDATAWPNIINSSRASGVAAPDGSTNGVTITTTTSSGARLEPGNIAISNATMYTASVWMRAGNSNGGLSLGDGGGTVYAYVKATLAGSGSVVLGGLQAGTAAASIERFSGGWYRVTLTYTSTTTSVRVGLHPWDGTADQFAYPASAVSATCSFWGVQLEAQGVASSYIPTAAAAVTRTAESLPNAFMPVQNGPVSVVAEWAAPGFGQNYPAVYCFGKGTSPTEEVTLYLTPGGSATVETKFGGVTISTLTAVTAARSVNRSATRQDANNFAASFNGAAVLTDTSGAFPNGIDRVSFGGFAARNGGTTSDPVWIRRFTVYGVALSDAQLQALSA